MKDMNLFCNQFDFHILSNNRVEGYFGFSRMKSATFDEYTFSVRQNIVVQELQKSLMKMPISNRRDRIYDVMESNSTSDSREELTNRKRRKTDSEVIDSSTKIAIRQFVQKYHSFPTKSIREEIYKQNNSTANERLQSQATIDVEIPNFTRPKILSIGLISPLYFTNNNSSIIHSVQKRSEELMIVVGDCFGKIGEAFIYRQNSNISLLLKLMHVTMKPIESFKLLLINEKLSDIKELKYKISKKGDKDVQLDVTLSKCTGRVNHKLYFKSDLEEFVSCTFRVQKNQPKGLKSISEENSQC